MLQEVGAYIAAKVSEQLVSMIAANIQNEPQIGTWSEITTARGV